MSSKDFTATFIVDKTPAEVFDAINNVREWWSQNIEGETRNLNDEFTYSYKDVHACRMRLIEVIPAKKVVWLVLNNYFNFTKDKTEWKDTKVIFEISKKDNQTELHFTHEGLTPEYECYEACRQGWTEYIPGSLYKLITKGRGQPNPKEGGFNEELVKKLNLKAQ